jgi:hypothetical protein
VSEYEAYVRVSVEANDFMDAVYEVSDGLGEGFTHYENQEAEIVLVKEQ